MRSKVKDFCELEQKMLFLLFLRLGHICDSERIHRTRQGETCSGKIKASQMAWQLVALMLSLTQASLCAEILSKQKCRVNAYL